MYNQTIDFNSQPGKSIWCEINSFYKWKIYLTNGKAFVGYSKRKDKPEVQDKIKLFQRCLIRLKKQRQKDDRFGYFTPMFVEKIEVFRRTDLGEYKEQLVTLFPTYYELHYNKNFNTNQTVIKFLDLFYNLIKKGEIDKLDYSSVGYSKITEEQIFSLDSGRFKNVTELQKTADELIIQGHTYDRVIHFVREYKLKNFSN